MDASAGAGLTTGAAAQQLGVAPTTLRSWDRRYGLGPAAREGGHHRRWTEEDMARLRRMCRLTASGVAPAEAARLVRTGPADGAPGAPAAPGAAEEAAGPAGTAGREGRRPGPPPGPRRPGGRTALPLGEAREECRGLARAAVRLDGPTIDEILDLTVAEQGLVAAWEDVVMPALRAVGRKWARSGERFVEVEHLLSWHVSSLLRRVAAAPSGRVQGPPVLLACTPGEMHTLPLEAVAAGLAERGLPLRMFGASVPPDALAHAVQRTGPVAVVLWSQTRPTAGLEVVRELQGVAWGVRGARRSPALVLAGPGWAGRRSPARAFRPRGLREALDLLEALCGHADRL
ncbi:MerR family transcriptional regulator [Streptacidiphilus sp. ASG 303]|uniref:MerR family transcriptional regulator n=1 Tax=Streptacidiphilus sp. ASG 303 TaxID=2896847 RepID=UPI001E33E5BE|nr:MerR family transcriptional regulator [Streptacidiphilus sp. ASG 303]MCD0480879.1 MerR family transcriptional regulator [Streptacidiphilus sp. ASG 303]